MKIFSPGDNYINLNKSEMDVSGYSRQSSNYNIDDDIDQAPSPAPGTPHATIPRSSLSHPNIHNQLLALQAMATQGKAIKVPASSEPRPLRVIITPPESENLLIRYRIENNVNNVSVHGKFKNAPKPPPKPRKRVSEIKEQFHINSNETVTQV